MNSEETTDVRAAPASGFTLIELLATVGLLAIMVAFLGQVFSQSSLAWERGTQQALRNANAKAALELLARDLEMAIVDSQFGFWKDRHDQLPWPIQFDALYFVTTGVKPEDGRSIQQIYYKVNLNTNYLDRGYSSTRLNRNERNFAEFPGAITNAFGGIWWNDLNAGWDTVPVIDDVVRFDVYLYSGDPLNFGENPTQQQSGPKANDFNSHDLDTVKYEPADVHRIPPYIDIYLQVASPDAMRRASAILTPPLTAAKRQSAQQLLDANSNVLFKRVYPRMRDARL